MYIYFKFLCEQITSHCYLKYLDSVYTKTFEVTGKLLQYLSLDNINCTFLLG